MTIKIRIFSSFCDSQNCKSVYERLCQTHLIANYGSDKDIYITTEDDYTHVIIMNTAMPEIKSNVPKKNVIGLAFEPPFFLGLSNQFIEYAKKNIGKYFIGNKYQLPEPFVEHYGYMWHMPPLNYIPTKTKLISITFSEKQQTDGHKYRHKLVQQILRTNLPIDIYGRGCKYYSGDQRIKGEFQELEPYESYHFHICIENLKTNHYFSEKITNPLLSGTIPIYLGCNNIDTYFPEMVIHLSSDLSEDINILKTIIENPEKYKKKINVEFVKEKINLVKNIRKIYSSI